MIPEKGIRNSPSPAILKKVGKCANLPLEKYSYLEIVTPGKYHHQGTPPPPPPPNFGFTVALTQTLGGYESAIVTQFLSPDPCMDKKWNSTIIVTMLC